MFLSVHQGLERVLIYLKVNFKTHYTAGNMKNKSIIYSKSTNPYFNLAAERILAESCREDEEILFLFVNSPCLVIGRFQNALIECNLPEINRKKIPLLRRYSGGGTVYHDKGNINFSFIQQRSGFSKEKNSGLIVKALKTLQIDAETNDRGDLFFKSRKLSGNAFKYYKTKVVHHGTLLVTADLVNLRLFVNSDKPDYIHSKGIDSVKSPVCSISEYFSGITVEKVLSSIETVFEAIETKKIIENSEWKEKTEEYIRQFKSWEWLWGNTPQFSLKDSESSLSIFFKNGKARIPSLNDYVNQAIEISLKPASLDAALVQLQELSKKGGSHSLLYINLLKKLIKTMK